MKKSKSVYGSKELNEVFYRMMVDYYEGLAKIETEHISDPSLATSHLLHKQTTLLKNSQEESLGRKLSNEEQKDRAKNQTTVAVILVIAWFLVAIIAFFYYKQTKKGIKKDLLFLDYCHVYST